MHLSLSQLLDLCDMPFIRGRLYIFMATITSNKILVLLWFRDNVITLHNKILLTKTFTNENFKRTMLIIDYANRIERTIMIIFNELKH